METSVRQVYGHKQAPKGEGAGTLQSTGDAVLGVSPGKGKKEVLITVQGEAVVAVNSETQERVARWRLGTGPFTFASKCVWDSASQQYYAVINSQQRVDHCIAPQHSTPQTPPPQPPHKPNNNNSKNKNNNKSVQPPPGHPQDSVSPSLVGCTHGTPDVAGRTTSRSSSSSSRLSLVSWGQEGASSTPAFSISALLGSEGCHVGVPAGCPAVVGVLPLGNSDHIHDPASPGAGGVILIQGCGQVSVFNEKLELVQQLDIGRSLVGDTAGTDVSLSINAVAPAVRTNGLWSFAVAAEAKQPRTRIDQSKTPEKSTKQNHTNSSNSSSGTSAQVTSIVAICTVHRTNVSVSTLDPPTILENEANSPTTSTDVEMGVAEDKAEGGSGYTKEEEVEGEGVGGDVVSLVSCMVVAPGRTVSTERVPNVSIIGLSRQSSGKVSVLWSNGEWQVYSASAPGTPTAPLGKKTPGIPMASLGKETPAPTNPTVTRVLTCFDFSQLLVNPNPTGMPTPGSLRKNKTTKGSASAILEAAPSSSSSALRQFNSVSSPLVCLGDTPFVAVTWYLKEGIHKETFGTPRNHEGSSNQGHTSQLYTAVLDTKYGCAHGLIELTSEGNDEGVSSSSTRQGLGDPRVPMLTSVDSVWRGSAEDGDGCLLLANGVAVFGAEVALPELSLAQALGALRAGALRNGSLLEASRGGGAAEGGAAQAAALVFRVQHADVAGSSVVPMLQGGMLSGVPDGAMVQLVAAATDGKQQGDEASATQKAKAEALLSSDAGLTSSDLLDGILALPSVCGENILFQQFNGVETVKPRDNEADPPSGTPKRGAILNAPSPLQSGGGSKVNEKSKERATQSPAVSHSLLNGSSSSKGSWVKLDPSVAEKLTEAVASLPASAITLCARHSLRLEAWHILDVLLETSLVSASLLPSLVPSLLEGKQLRLLDRALQFVSDFSASDIALVLQWLLRPGSPALHASNPVAKRWKVAAERAIEKLKSQSTGKSGAAGRRKKKDGVISPKEGNKLNKQQAVNATGAVSVLLSVSGFSNAELSLHRLLLTPFDDQVLSVALGRLQAETIVPLLTYLTKWVVHLSGTPVVSSIKHPKLNSLKCPELTNVLRWLGLLVDNHLARLLMHSETWGDLQTVHRVMNESIASANSLKALHGSLSHMCMGLPLPLLGGTAATNPSYSVEYISF